MEKGVFIHPVVMSSLREESLYTIIIEWVQYGGNLDCIHSVVLSSIGERSLFTLSGRE